MEPSLFQNQLLLLQLPARRLARLLIQTVVAPHVELMQQHH